MPASPDVNVTERERGGTREPASTTVAPSVPSAIAKPAANANSVSTITVMNGFSNGAGAGPDLAARRR